MPLRCLPLCLLAVTFFGFLPVQAGQIDLTGPPGSGSFGSSVTVLPNGNFIVADFGYDAPGPIADVGAVYLYDGNTIQVISVLNGSTANDRVGSGGIYVLPNGDYVVRSDTWNGNRGAATWGSGTGGVSGTVSASNSLVGSTANDRVGVGGIIVLSNGNYVVLSSEWNGNRGAATWGSGTSGVSGAVSSSNSLVGSAAGDYVGIEVHVLPNGNYVVRSDGWNGGRGAVTWGSGTVGVLGVLSSSNSLVGSTADDRVGSNGINVLPNGNYVVGSYSWNVIRGAATWGSGTSGVSGVVSSSNSLVGSTVGDRVGFGGIYVLPNGNYVVGSHEWDIGGAATWGSGTVGVSGAVSASNSLVGSTAFDQVGRGIAVLSNGNYVVQSPHWHTAGNYRLGAATWGSGTSGVSGAVSSSNSLVGSTTDDYVGFEIHVLPNGNYVVRTTAWDNGATADVGAVTWGSGTAGVSGAVSASNSLVGSTAFDQVGNGGIAVLPNGNYVVGSFSWDNRAIINVGAATWTSGTAGLSGTVSSSNSLVGSSANDRVGNRIQELPNGNYVVRSSEWNGRRGAATWGSGLAGVSGTVSSSNSLVGSAADDFVGSGITVLSNGNYVVGSSNWNGYRGAATWGSGMSGMSGTVSSSNSLVGSTANDYVGFDGIVALPNGNYLIRSPKWGGNRGAVTLGGGNAAAAGMISSSNSLVGSIVDDKVGGNGIVVLPNGNYVVRSATWNGNRGAVTWGSGTTGVSGQVSSSNSLLGSTAGDQVGNISVLSNGNYAVRSTVWDNGSVANAGAVTLGDGVMGTIGPVISANSVLGTTTNGGNTMVFSDDPVNSRVVVGYPAANRVSLFGYVPEMSVSGNSATVADGETIPATKNHTDFGKALAGSGSEVHTFTISNSGMERLDLTGSPRVAVSGIHSVDFTVTAQPGAVVGSAASATFQVTFTPGGIGLRTAILSIANNDSNESLYDFAIQGIGQTMIENWRSTYFGDATVNIGNLEDFDADGVNNLFEFAFGTLPNNKASGPSSLQYAGTFAGGGTITATGQPLTQFAGLLDGMDFRVLFVRRKDYAAAGLSYTPQFSVGLNTWENSTAVLTVLADDGTHQIVSVPYPSFITSGKAGFFKITVTLE